MRPTTAAAARTVRLLMLPPLAALALACDDAPSPHEPLAPDDGTTLSQSVPSRQELAALLGDRARWADGYLAASNPLTPSYSPATSHAFNRSGGPMTITKPAGTTGQYIATFSGLSALLGSRSTVHVTSDNAGGAGIPDDTYCKPVTAYLVRDKVEVRCFRASTGAASNATFRVLIIRNYADLAFAFAHKPTKSGYSPSTAGSWNPAGASKVVRDGVGQYHVDFNGLGAQLPAGVAGHVQVNAVGSGDAHCKVRAWGGSPDRRVLVVCFTAAGQPVDTKFAVIFLMPTDHLAYAWANEPFLSSYAPTSAYSSNPAGGPIVISRSAVGKYTVSWAGVDPEILGGGTVQVTAHSADDTQCKANTINGAATEAAEILCFGPNGAPRDSYYTVLLGS